MTTYPTRAMSRVPAARRTTINTVKTVAEYIGISALAILYGAAYAASGFYLAVFLDALAVPTFWQTASTHAWVAGGAVALTIWVLRFAGIDVRRRDDRKAGVR